ncbi:MAG: metallophosphoesterase family protein [Proteobacteria bacterium]|nr:metallophosphoesterase family protein [Pseudomonadota bacterium]
MKIGIFSDLHSNLNAFRVVMDFYREHPCDEYLCLGDVVGYGPQPDECCNEVKKFANLTILGNHDAAVCGRMNYTYYYEAARNVLDYHAGLLSHENMAWLKDMPYKHKHDKGFTICHGSPIDPAEFNYVFFIEQANQLLPHYEELDHITFIGHSHLTKSFALTPDSAVDISASSITFEDDRKYIVTVGSVGQPRDYDNRACCTIYDTETRTIQYYRIPYDIEDTVKRLFASEITYNFGKRLYLGI